jgi:hypothetical protein
MRIKHLILTLALMMSLGAVQAQGFLGKIKNAVKNVVPQMEQPADIPPANMTPQAIIANAPGLPSPEEWADNDGAYTDAFMVKIKELQKQLDLYAAQGAQQPTQADVDKAADQADKQLAQSDEMLQSMFGMNIDEMQNMSDAEIQAKMMPKAKAMQGGAMAQAQQKMQVLYSLGITDADLEKMDSMSDKQSEAYIEKRLKENGYTGADLEAALRKAGISQISDAEAAQAQRNSNALKAQSNTLNASGNTIMDFLAQKEVTDKKIEEAGQTVMRRLDDLLRRHQPVIAAANPKGFGWEDVMMGAITESEYNAIMARVVAAIRDYRVALFPIWVDYVGTVQGHLKFLMPYAQQADDAQVDQVRIGAARAGVAAEREGASMHTLTVAGHYLSITASQPNSDWKREIKE